MLTLSARTTVQELQQGPPALTEVLRTTGLYRDGDDPTLTIGQLCWSWGFNPGILLMLLQSANVPPKEAPLLDISPFLAMPLPAFVTHIEEVYHAGLRTQIPRLRTLTTDAAALSPCDERLLALRDELEQLAAELSAHLLHEEEALFPMIRGLAAGTVVATRCGNAVGGPIACMENDHATAERSLQRLQHLTDGYTAPVSAGEMLRLLREFDRDLREHMYKENEGLFPRALEAQTAASRPPVSQPA